MKALYITTHLGQLEMLQEDLETWHECSMSYSQGAGVGDTTFRVVQSNDEPDPPKGRVVFSNLTAVPVVVHLPHRYTVGLGPGECAGFVVDYGEEIVVYGPPPLEGNDGGE